jgi:arylsulfate sulfotransferase
MRLYKNGFLCLLGMVALHAPVFATVTIVSLTPSRPSPQKIGKSITWTATATDTSGPLTFQFNVAPPNRSLALVEDFNVGKLKDGAWSAQPFVWVPTGIEGTYRVQVVVKDFGSGETASKTIYFRVSPLVTAGNPVVKATANPLVALFSAPSCAAGSTMRVSFQDQAGSKPATTTNWIACHPPASMTFEIAGMYPKTAYNMYAETDTGGNITSGVTVSFTTGALPTSARLPSYKVVVAGSDAANPVIIHGNKAISGPKYAQAATDLAGNIIWYYYPSDGNVPSIMRPLQNGGFLVHQDGYAWNPAISEAQFLRQMDLAGNIVRETNIGVLQQQLVAAGAVDGGPCTAFSKPAPVGSACIVAFHHDSIMRLPNGFTASLVDIEKIFPKGTQGDTSGDPVDIVGDMIIVLDQNWQLFWYWDVFDPAGGGNGYSKLPVSRTAILGETCGPKSRGCPPMLLLSPGIAPLAHDWTHGNALYYWPAPEDGNTQGGDIIYSSREQDSIMKIDYQDGAGTGDMLWRMGPPDNLTPVSDFTFNNIYSDPWPWFSHQHEVGIENGGTGPMTMFDNGNTRVSAAPLGLGSNCGPYDCNNRGMVVNFSESTMQVTPVMSVDLGYYSPANGSAQLLADGNYFFLAGIVFISTKEDGSFSLEVGPTPVTGNADVIVNLEGVEQYRGWQVPNMYNPPIT